MHLRPNEGKWEATRLGPSQHRSLLKKRVFLGYFQMLSCYCNEGQFKQALQLRDEKMHSLHALSITNRNCTTIQRTLDVVVYSYRCVYD